MLARLNQSGFGLISTSLLALVGVGAVGGDALAVAAERSAVAAAEVSVSRAHSAFVAQVTISLGEGTPADAIESLRRQEATLLQAAPPPHAFFVDRKVILALQARAGAIRSLAEAVYGAQVQTAVAIQDQVRDAVVQMRADASAARDVGLDITDYDSFLASVVAQDAALLAPLDASQLLDLVQSRDAALRDATATRMAANRAAAAAAAALAAAQADAGYTQSRAHRDLSAAQATRSLQVDANTAAISALDGQLAAAQTTADFTAVAAGFRAQAGVLEQLLWVRDADYRSLQIARYSLARAQRARANTADLAPRIDGDAAALDSAATLGQLLGISGDLKSIADELDARYFDALAHPPPPAGAVVLNVPFHRQVYSLDCEAAALQMALGKEGINASQDQILSAIGVDGRRPQWDGQGNLHWGDPYSAFVGDPNGSFEGANTSRPGYGVYYPPVASAATSLGGHVIQSGEGISPATLYDAVKAGHPAVVWVAYQYSPHATSSYVAFDGRTVMYGAPWEHAVALSGVAPGSVKLSDPHGGEEWIDNGTFEAAYAMFNDMAVIIS